MTKDINQFTLSYELLFLMEWLLEHEQETLKIFMQQCFKNGLKEHLKNMNADSQQRTAEMMHYNIIDFLGLIETIMYEVQYEETLKHKIQKKLMPALDHIDVQECDSQTVMQSLEQTSSQLEYNPKINPEQLLFKELLRCWKPTKKAIKN